MDRRLMAYPKGYEWLGTIGTLPKMVQAALALHGTRETVGAANNPVIMRWRDELVAAGVSGVKDYYGDAVPWCGLFMAIVAHRAGKPVVAGPLWALNWGKFGTAAERPVLGDVLTFQREGGGHVGLYLGEDVLAFHVLGGNQGDAVSVVRIAKSRLKAKRHPPFATAMPASARPYILATGGALSSNEA